MYILHESVSLLIYTISSVNSSTLQSIVLSFHQSVVFKNSFHHYVSGRCQEPVRLTFLVCGDIYIGPDIHLHCCVWSYISGVGGLGSLVRVVEEPLYRLRSTPRPFYVLLRPFRSTKQHGISFFHEFLSTSYSFVELPRDDRFRFC